MANPGLNAAIAPGAANGEPSAEARVAPDDPPEQRYWRRNLAVVLVGSFTTLVAMSLMLPFLPLYVEQLGVTDRAAIAEWSGTAYGATFLAAALVAPLWGRLADRFGRKAMLIRASLGMAIAMSLIGMAHNVYELVALRLLVGLAGGYSSGSTILVATQTPRARSGWALGTLLSGIMAGNLVGPLIGGALPPLVGIRNTFWLAGAVIFVTFIATTTLIKEEKRPAATRKAAARAKWSSIPDKRPVLAMLATGMLLMLANMSIEPIITIYVAQLVEDQSRVTLVSGVVMSAAALGTILSASRLGKLADRIGHWTVLVAALLVSALLLIPQAFVTNGWELIGLRFLMGLALGGLLPCVTSVIRHNVPEGMIGRILGYSTSSQYAGQVVGPLLGGFVGGHIGMRAVFIGTSALMALGALMVRVNRPRAAASVE
jgi:MFS family permease